MAIINEDFEFNLAPIGDRQSFRGSPRKMIWHPGKPLFRFLTPNKNFVLSPFWYGEDTWRQVLEHCHRGELSISDVARARLAVKTEWNPEMSKICKLDLLQPAYVWIGPAKYQRLSDHHDNVLLMGNLEQVYLPNLLERDENGSYALSSKFARIIYHGSIS